MNSRFRRSSLVLLSVLSLSLVGAACQESNPEQAQRLEKIETSLTQIPGVVARLQTLEGKEGSLSSQVAGVQTALTELEAEVAEFQGEVDGSRTASQEAKKKADELSSRISALSAKVDSLGNRVGPLDQKISLLQTRYDDHLRKYHSGG